MSQDALASFGLVLLRHLIYRVQLHCQLTEHFDVQLALCGVMVPCYILFGVYTPSFHDMKLGWFTR